MASTLLVKDIVYGISVLLQDTAPQFQRWPEKEIILLLNAAQLVIVKFLPLAGSRVDSIRLVPGTRQSIKSIPAAYCLPGDGSTPSAAISGIQFLSPRRNMGALGATAGKAVRMVERDVLDSQDPDWHTRVGTAVSSVIFDPSTPDYFYVTPGVHGSTQVWMEMAYTAQPIAIPAGGAPGSEVYAYSGSSTATISIGDEFGEDLIDYVVAKANMKDVKYADKTAAQFHTQRFLGSLNAKIAAVSGANPNLTILPGVTSPGAAA